MTIEEPEYEDKSILDCIIFFFDSDNGFFVNCFQSIRRFILYK
jgi:hypothetical protein